MEPSTAASKPMSVGEGGLAIIFALTALLALAGAARADEAPFAFHAYLAAAASVASVFAIINHYFQRPAVIPAEIDGRPNYNFAPIKFATLASVFWGIAGFTVGL